MAECVAIDSTPYTQLDENCKEPGELIGVALFDTKNPAFDLDDAMGDWSVASDWDDEAKWSTLIASGAIITIGGKKKIEGNKPKSSPVNAEFAGRQIEITRDHTGEFTHRGVDDNTSFWSNMNKTPSTFACGFVYRDGQMAVPILKTRGALGVVTANKLQGVDYDADWDAEGGRSGQRLFKVAVSWENADLMVFKKIPASLFQ